MCLQLKKQTLQFYRYRREYTYCVKLFSTKSIEQIFCHNESFNSTIRLHSKDNFSYYHSQTCIQNPVRYVAFCERFGAFCENSF